MIARKVSASVFHHTLRGETTNPLLPPPTSDCMTRSKRTLSTFEVPNTFGRFSLPTFDIRSGFKEHHSKAVFMFSENNGQIFSLSRRGEKASTARTDTKYALAPPSQFHRRFVTTWCPPETPGPPAQTGLSPAPAPHKKTNVICNE